MIGFNYNNRQESKASTHVPASYAAPKKDLEWDSGLSVVTESCVYIPYEIIYKLNKINAQFTKEEFSIYFDYTREIKEDKIIFTISDSIYIPDQEVSAGAVEYKESPPRPNMGVLHKHPEGCKSFSKDDKEYINTNFDLSILYIPPNSFPQGIWNFSIENGVKIQMPINKAIIVPADLNCEIEGLNKIKTRPALTYTQGTVGYAGSYYGGYHSPYSGEFYDDLYEDRPSVNSQKGGASSPKVEEQVAFSYGAKILELKSGGAK